MRRRPAKRCPAGPARTAAAPPGEGGVAARAACAGTQRAQPASRRTPRLLLDLQPPVRGPRARRALAARPAPPRPGPIPGRADLRGPWPPRPRARGEKRLRRHLALLSQAPATHMPNGEEDECGGEQQGQHVAEGRERERHGRGGGAGSSAGASGERRRRALWVKPFTSRDHNPHRRRCRRGGASPPSTPAHQPGCKAPSGGRSPPCNCIVCIED